MDLQYLENLGVRVATSCLSSKIERRFDLIDKEDANTIAYNIVTTVSGKKRKKSNGNYMNASTRSGKYTSSRRRRVR